MRHTASCIPTTSNSPPPPTQDCKAERLTWHFRGCNALDFLIITYIVLRMCYIFITMLLQVLPAIYRLAAVHTMLYHVIEEQSCESQTQETQGAREARLRERCTGTCDIWGPTHTSAYAAEGMKRRWHSARVAAGAAEAAGAQQRQQGATSRSGPQGQRARRLGGRWTGYET